MATFNLRMDTEKDGVNAWPNRKEMVKGLIRFHDFDIFGTQEGFKHMLDGIAELDGYAYIGAGRDDGEDAGEHSAIFYKTSRFDLLDKGNFWFSETPDVPGKGWDATCCNRICSWGKFRDKESGKVFYFFNSHYDHQGKVARRESSKLLIARIKQIAGTDATVFATGDFNAVPTDEPMVTLASDGLLLDWYGRYLQQLQDGFRDDEPHRLYLGDEGDEGEKVCCSQRYAVRSFPVGSFSRDDTSHVLKFI